MDVLRTPKSSSITRRRSLFPHLENVDLSPSKSLSTSPSSRRSKKKELPAKFKQEMPRQSQVDNEAKENQVKMSPIKKSSFYSNANYVPKWQQNLDKALETKMVLKTPSPKSSKKPSKSSSASRIVLNKNGINKGVSHAIKKPKMNKKPEKPVKSGSESQSEESDAEVAVKKIPVPKKLTELIYAPDSGKLNMAKDKSVCYDIKNGQMTFKYSRRGRGSNGSSPRKSPYFNKLRTPNSDPKTPKQLFTPSSKSDFIDDWQASPDRNSRRHQLPSPVKFHNDHDNEDSNMEHEQVSSIIESLEKSQDDYAMYVTDDELARVAQETVEELEDLRHHEKSNLNLELHEILAKIDPPTEQEIKEKRNASGMLPLELEDESSNEAFETPTKAKFFPIFDKNRQVLPSTTSKNNSPAKNTRSQNQKLDKDQMIIDAGQALTDLETCLECSFVYNPGNQEDDAEHSKYHSMSKQGLKFQGWKSQHVVGDFIAEDAKIIVVKPHDHFSHWAKVHEVLNVVDKQLGIITDENSRYVYFHFRN